MKTLATPADRRTPVRLTALLIAAEASPGDLPAPVTGLVRNLGRTGTLLLVSPETAERFAENDRFRLTLEPPDDTHELTLEVRLTGTVPDLKDHQGDPRTGLELELLEEPSGELREQLTALIRSLQPALLLVGFGEESHQTMESLLGRGIPLLSAGDEEEAMRWLDEREIAVLCLGERLREERARDFLTATVECFPGNSTVNLVLAGGRDPAIFQDLVFDDRIYYLTQEPVLNADLVAIVRSAINRWWSLRLGDSGPETEEGAHRLQQIVEIARRVALQRTLDEAGALTEEAIRELLTADRAYYLIYEPSEELLWSGDPGSHDHRQESAAVGLVSFVARTGRAVLLDRLAEDPRYEQEADDPEGEGNERFLAVPVRASNRSVLAVLVAVRSAERPAFSDQDLVGLEVLADQVTSSFSQLVLQSRLDQMQFRREEQLQSETFSLFRDEAVGHHAGNVAQHGDVLRLSPRWIHWTYWLLLTLLVSGLLFSMLFSLREWASGPAMVRIEGNRDITATTAGVVTALTVASGERVEQGQELVRFYGAREAAELQRIEQDFEAQLLDRLRNPADPRAEQALIQLRGQRRLAEAQLAERSLQAPFGGQVADVRVREGQSVVPGDIVVSLVAESTEPKLLAMLPGHYRPQLEPGMQLRFEVQGYEYAYLDLTIDSVGAEVVGPTEARRYLGPGLSDVVSVPGPVIFVEAHLPGISFEALGKPYDLHDGMVGIAEVPVRSEPILVSLFPRVKQVIEQWDDWIRGAEPGGRDG